MANGLIPIEKVKKMLHAVHAQSQHQSFINASTCEDFDDWIKGFRQKLEKEITTLEKAIACFS